MYFDKSRLEEWFCDIKTAREQVDVQKDLRT